MSREDVCQCAESRGYVTNPMLCKGCGKARRFEPARAEAPKGEQYELDHSGCEHEEARCTAYKPKKPAAQPETAGDEARARESYLQWGMWQKKADELAAENRELKAKIDKAYEAGRAAENEDLVQRLRNIGSRGTDAIADAFAKRRGGGG